MHAPPPIPGHPRLDYLDGLRAIAALWVVLGHCHLFALGWNAHYSVFTLPLNILLYLHLAVDVFLVLSGFCLALPRVQAGRDEPVDWGDFLRRRALRILPPYLATLLLILQLNAFIPVVAWGRHPLGLTPEIPVATLLVNALLLQDIFPQHNTVNGPFWSIAIEWHLYLLFPLAVWMLRRAGALALLAAGLGLALGLTLLSQAYPVISSRLGLTIPQPPYFVALFVMGMTAAQWSYGGRAAPSAQAGDGGKTARAPVWPWLLLAVLLLPLLGLIWNYRILDGQTVHAFNAMHHWIDPLCGAVTACLLVCIARARFGPLVRRWLEWRPLVAVGGYSYSLYLIHIPILAVCWHVLESHRFWVWPYAGFLGVVIVGGGISLLAARHFAHIFETRRWLQVARAVRTALAGP